MRLNRKEENGCGRDVIREFKWMKLIKKIYEIYI